MTKSITTKYSKWVMAWLIVGLFMLLFQVLIGGVTRLTGSGLSITKWEIVIGSLPPLNEQQWNEAFDLYKATPQFEKINRGMDLSEFKFIYFWEFLHRFWARLMGIVFVIPFFIFWRKKLISSQLGKRLMGVVVLAGLAAAFGWIMVASGLVNRPWVNAYKLSLHLLIGFSVFAYLLWATFEYKSGDASRNELVSSRKWIRAFFFVLIAQIILGGWMSGMKAGYSYPTWPDMNGEIIPSVLKDGSEWSVANLVAYDEAAFAPALVQFLHRSTAYLLMIIGFGVIIRSFRNAGNQASRMGVGIFAFLLMSQVILGILTVISFHEGLPLTLGVLHQIVALLLSGSVLYLLFLAGKKNPGTET